MQQCSYVYMAFLRSKSWVITSIYLYLHGLQIKKKSKRKEDLQFMIVNNTDHLLEDDSGIKLLVTSEEQGSVGKAERTSSGVGGEDTIFPAIDGENLAQMIAKAKEEEKVKSENIEVGVSGSVEMSGLESGGKKKKKKRKKSFTAEELEGNELNILPETSMDQSARETEELYLKLEKANRDLWLHQSASSSKKEKDTHMSGEVVKLDNVAQGSPEQGVEEVDDAGTKRSIADDVAQENNVGDTMQNPHLVAGTTEASDREEDVFLSQGKVPLLIKLYIEFGHSS